MVRTMTGNALRGAILGLVAGRVARGRVEDAAGHRRSSAALLLAVAGPGARRKQTAYQVQVASRAELLASGKAGRLG
jgi:hypothetical protein